jgi:UDP-N-acetylmuramoylalanine--D-glutamate ligase
MKKYLKEKFNNKKILILGLGREGMSTFGILRDVFPDMPLGVADREEKEVGDGNVVKFFGEDYLNHIDDFDVIVKSPGISALKKEIVRAIEKGIEVTSQTKIFFEVCRGKIIGITGTKGKSTTSSLLYEMLKQGGLDVSLAGNIGTPVLSSLENDSPDKHYVFELSSHQLFDLTKSPHVSIVTNVAVDHLDWYGQFETYVEAKANIVKFQNENDTAILNYDNLIARQFDRFVKGKLFYTSKETQQEGSYTKDGMIHININGSDEILGDAKDLNLIGKHNWDNVMQAALAAKILGIDNKTIWDTAVNFRQLEHHLEFVREVNGIKFYNDSFAVDQIATTAAVNSFEGGITLILGGYDRGIDYKELADLISKRENIKGIIVIGQIADKIVDSLKKSGYPGRIVKLGTVKMEKIVDAAMKNSNQGDVVLFSPAAASFDMFKDYKDRGVQFKQSVLELK